LNEDTQSSTTVRITRSVSRRPPRQAP
jgi:hypothetical protein